MLFNRIKGKYQIKVTRIAKMTEAKLMLMFLLMMETSLFLSGCKDDGKASNVIENLPADGVYSTTEESKGSYKDPIHGFFSVEPPSGFQAKERLDKTIFNVTEGSHAGEELACSWVDFKRSGATIGAIARKTYEQNIEKDFNSVKNKLKEHGAKMLLDRYVTIDSVKGGEFIVRAKDFQFHGINYIKHGLNHSLTLGGSPRDYNRYQKDFLDFVRSYRSIKPE